MTVVLYLKVQMNYPIVLIAKMAPIFIKHLLALGLQLTIIMNQVSFLLHFFLFRLQDKMEYIVVNSYCIANFKPF